VGHAVPAQETIINSRSSSTTLLFDALTVVPLALQQARPFLTATFI
jgi:hypothetical protein